MIHTQKKYDIIITGGTGFIGRALVNVIAGDGTVLVMDQMRPEGQKAAQNVDFLEQDIRKIERLPKVDYLYHLAGYKAPANSPDEWKDYESINVDGTRRLLDSVKGTGIKRLIFMSTAGVYGNSPPVPTSENAPTDASHNYSRSKLMGEELVMRWSKEQGIAVTIFRGFNVYGPGQSAQSPMAPLVMIFKKRVRDGKPIILYGDGGQTRDFIHLGEVVRIFNMCRSGDPKYDGVFNLGTGKETSIKELALRIMEIEGKEVPFEHMPARMNDPKRSCADVTRLESVFGPVNKTLRLDF